jgi:hypothetical protein
MNQLSADILKRIFEETYAELYPYYSNIEIISQSKYDLYKETNLTELKSNMLFLYDQLIIYRDIFLKYLEPQNSTN